MGTALIGPDDAAGIGGKKGTTYRCRKCGTKKSDVFTFHNELIKKIEEVSMIIFGLAVIVFIVMIALAIGAVYWSLWVLTTVFAIAMAVAQIKYMEWQKKEPSSTKCPECGAYMLVKTVNQGSSGTAVGTMVTSDIGIGSVKTQNHYGQLMTCRACGHQEYRLTRQMINDMQKKYKGRRNIYIVFFLIFLTLATLLSNVISDDNSSASGENSESISAQNNDESDDSLKTDSSNSKYSDEIKRFSLYGGFMTAELPASWNYDETTDSMLCVYPSGSSEDREAFSAFYGDFNDSYDDVDISERLKAIGQESTESGENSSTNDLEQEIISNDAFGVVLRQTYKQDYSPSGNNIVMENEEYYCPVNNGGIFGVMVLARFYEADLNPKFEKEFFDVFIPGISINGIDNIIIRNEQDNVKEDPLIDTNDTDEEKSAGSNTEDRLKKALGEELSAHVESVLKDEIGFTEVEFIDRQSDNDNYSFICDGGYILVTAFSGEEGDYIRVFEPNTDNVLYEDGKLLMTKTDLDEGADKTAEKDENIIYAEDTSTYQIIAEEIVRSCMKNPSKANFPSAFSDEWAYGKKGDLIAVQSYVDGTNSFNATIRSQFLVEFYLTDKDAFSYEIQYVRIGDDEQGEFIDVSQ